MKKGLVFFLGMVVGAILTIVILFFISIAKMNGVSVDSNYDDPGISMFSEAGPTMPLKSFRIFQVLPNGSALANSSEKSKVKYNFEYGEPVVLLLPQENNSFYDDQIITVPASKTVHQVGTYRYETKSEFVKTVPIVSFLDN